MRKTILLMLGMAAMLASCSQDELDVAQGTGVAVITATVDNGIATRSTYSYDDVDITRCLLEVHDAEGALVGTQHSAEAQADGTFTFNVRGLDPAKEYTFAFWADNGSAYNAADLAAVTIADNADAAEALAFSGTTTSNPGEISATLTHAVAKMTLNTTGKLNSGDNVAVTVSGASTTVNVLTGEASGTGEYSSNTTLSEDMTSGDVMTFYVPASTTGQTGEMTITYKANGWEGSDEKTITNVPMQANYRTRVRGDIGAIGSSDITATMDKNWNSNDDIELGEYEIELETAGQLTTEMLDNAVSWNDGKVKISGQMNQAHIATLIDYFNEPTTNDENTDTQAAGGEEKKSNIILDMSKATLVGESTEWPDSKNLAVKEIIFPNGLTSIAASAFENNKHIKSVTFPSTLTNLGNFAFKEALELSGKLIIPESINSIGSQVFFNTNITSLEWNSNQFIKDNTFGYCDKLKTVTIKSDVDTFAPNAFDFSRDPSDRLESITFENITKVPDYFYSSSVGDNLASYTKIYVPANLVEQFKVAEDWSNHADQIYPIE